MTNNILVQRPDHLTLGWAQGIVDQHSTDTRALKVDIQAIDIGTTTRVKLSIEHDGPETLPKRWFVKFPSMSWKARLITALPRLLQTEVRFYREIAPNLPISRPAVLAGQSGFGRGATLVLSDVTEFGATPGRPSDILTHLQAIKVIEQLARFHACYWNTVQQDQNFNWLAAPVRRLEDMLGTLLAVPLMKRGLKLAGKHVPSHLHGPTMHYARKRKAAMQFLSEKAQTLIHHDCHPGNLFWHQSIPGFLDWQMVRIGEGVSDVAYFLATALDPEIRRSHEHRLLETYLQALAEKGISGLDQKNLILRYRAHLVYAFEAMVVTLAVGGLMPEASNLELIRRTAKAVEDNDAFSVLPIY